MRDISLSPQDKERLVTELSTLPAWEFGDKGGERGILRTAGLPRGFVSSFPLTGIPEGDAASVVDSLCGIGHLADRPTHFALGALAEYLLDRAVDVEGKVFMAYLIQQYGLVSDLSYLEGLQQRYGLLLRPSPDGTLDLGWATDQPEFTWEGTTDDSALERIWSQRAPFLDAVFLELGARTARAVCRVETAKGKDVGTGFLVGPDLVLTNYHVRYWDGKVISSQVHFGYRIGSDGTVAEGETYQVEEVLKKSPPDELDYALLRIDGSPGSDKTTGYLTPVLADLKQGMPVYIIQHPSGEPQKVVLQDNQVTYVHPDGLRVQYLANTEHGSSGSPVCDEGWQLVALHHSGRPRPRPKWPTFVRGNEGIPMAPIMKEIGGLLP